MDEKNKYEPTLKGEENMSRQFRRQLERAGEIKTAEHNAELGRLEERVAQRHIIPVKSGTDPRQSTEPHGKRNIYTCDACFGHVVTVDLVEGVTPFLIGCKATPGCSGMMQSSMYRVFDQRMRPGFEWFKPTKEETMALHTWSRDHVAKGGLILRPCADK